MSYHITSYTKDKAKRLGVEVAPSTRKNKKIDVYRDGKFIHSIGDKRYKDFPTYAKEDGMTVAKERQRLYHLRHKKNSIGERLASYLLW
jgi:hypothetical protein